MKISKIILLFTLTGAAITGVLLVLVLFVLRPGMSPTASSVISVVYRLLWPASQLTPGGGQTKLQVYGYLSLSVASNVASYAFLGFVVGAVRKWIWRR